jgi:outer membrane protein insertion porin family
VAYQQAVGNKTIHSWTSSLGFTHDTRNSYWAPTRGGQLTASISGALPGSTVQFYKIFGEANHYWPIGKGFVLYLDGQVGYGKTYGQKYDNNGYSYTANADGTVTQNTIYTKGQKIDFPFWENYYGGGVRDVRGFQDTLGPRLCDGGSTTSVPNSKGQCAGGYYTYGQPIGGAFKVLGTAQMFLPLPFLKDVNTARVSWFVDVGNVYKDYASFNASDLRASTGLSLQWQAPIGPLIINFAVPFRKKEDDNRFVERIQFTFGNTF